MKGSGAGSGPRVHTSCLQLTSFPSWWGCKSPASRWGLQSCHLHPGPALEPFTGPLRGLPLSPAGETHHTPASQCPGLPDVAVRALAPAPSVTHCSHSRGHLLLRACARPCGAFLGAHRPLSRRGQVRGLSSWLAQPSAHRHLPTLPRCQPSAPAAVPRAVPGRCLHPSVAESAGLRGAEGSRAWRCPQTVWTRACVHSLARPEASQMLQTPSA